MSTPARTHPTPDDGEGPPEGVQLIKRRKAAAATTPPSAGPAQRTLRSASKDDAAPSFRGVLKLTGCSQFVAVYPAPSPNAATNLRSAPEPGTQRSPPYSTARQAAKAFDAMASAAGCGLSGLNFPEEEGDEDEGEGDDSPGQTRAATPVPVAKPAPPVEGGAVGPEARSNVEVAVMPAASPTAPPHPPPPPSVPVPAHALAALLLEMGIPRPSERVLASCVAKGVNAPFILDCATRIFAASQPCSKAAGEMAMGRIGAALELNEAGLITLALGMDRVAQTSSPSGR